MLDIPNLSFLLLDLYFSLLKPRPDVLQLELVLTQLGLEIFGVLCQQMAHVSYLFDEVFLGLLNECLQVVLVLLGYFDVFPHLHALVHPLIVLELVVVQVFELYPQSVVYLLDVLLYKNLKLRHLVVHLIE